MDGVKVCFWFYVWLCWHPWCRTFFVLFFRILMDLVWIWDVGFLFNVAKFRYVKYCVCGFCLGALRVVLLVNLSLLGEGWSRHHAELFVYVISQAWVHSRFPSAADHNLSRLIWTACHILSMIPLLYFRADYRYAPCSWVYFGVGWMVSRCASG